MPSGADVGSIGWRIPYIPHTAPGGRGYRRVYGWGWLGPLGLLSVVIGASGLAFAKDAPIWLILVFGGFLLAFGGTIFNGLSERRRMQRVRAQCVDVEIRDLAGTTYHSGGPAVRAQMRYTLDGRSHEATPGPLGYLLLGRRETAEAFAAHLKSAAFVELDVDPHHPTRALFVEHGPPPQSVQS